MTTLNPHRLSDYARTTKTKKPPICFLSQIGGFMSIPLEEFLAEREGFEPSVRLPVQRFSRPSRSTTPASFLKPSAKLRLFSEKHHFYPIFFNQNYAKICRIT